RYVRREVLVVRAAHRILHARKAARGRDLVRLEVLRRVDPRCACFEDDLVLGGQLVGGAGLDLRALDGLDQRFGSAVVVRAPEAKARVTDDGSRIRLLVLDGVALALETQQVCAVESLGTGGRRTERGAQGGAGGAGLGREWGSRRIRSKAAVRLVPVGERPR